MWTPGEGKLTVETPFDPLPCSDSGQDAFTCNAQCSDAWPDGGGTCNNRVGYDTLANCRAGCLGWNPHTRAHTVDYLGADGGATALVDGDAGTANSARAPPRSIPWAPLRPLL
jgi:hypothetical protein